MHCTIVQIGLCLDHGHCLVPVHILLALCAEREIRARPSLEKPNRQNFIVFAPSNGTENALLRGRYVFLFMRPKKIALLICSPLSRHSRYFQGRLNFVAAAADAVRKSACNPIQCSTLFAALTYAQRLTYGTWHMSSL